MEIIEHLCLNQIRNRRILITGATGFLGFYLTEILLEANRLLKLENTVIICVRNVNKAFSLFRHRFEQGSLQLVVGDLCDGVIIPKAKIDYIIHAAMPSDARSVRKNSTQVIQSAIKGTETVLHLAEKHDTKSIVYVSSVTVYGKTDEATIIAEDYIGLQDWKNESDSYMLGKRVAEHLMLLAAKNNDISIKIIRPGFVFGANPMRDSRVYNAFIEKAAMRETIELLSDGTLTRPLVYVMDVVKAVLLVLGGEKTDCYNVLDKEYSLLEFAKCVSDSCDLSLKGEYINKNTGEMLDNVRYSARKIKQEYAWKPTDFSDAIKESIKMKQLMSK